MNMKSFLVVITAAFLASTAPQTMARGGGHADGAPRGHSADMGFPNTNRQSLPTAETGLDRAGERMNEEALEHSKAFERHIEKQHKLKKR
jgi:hypothetical protein